MTTFRSVIVLAIAMSAATGCKDPKGASEISLRPAAIVPTTKPLDNTEPFIMDRRHREDEIAEMMNGSKDKKAKDAKKGDQQDEEWIPKENIQGAARWKDTGVYVDGIPVGFLAWGELPLNLKPVWIKDKVSANKRPGTTDLGWRWARQRHYRFRDYLIAVGIDPKKVKEVHVYGPKFTQTNISTGADLMSPAADRFMFRFGSNVGGKAIPQIPDEYGNGKTPDKIAAVMVYIDKEAPKMVPHEGLFLDGVLMVGVPHGGEPIRGGIRIYFDNIVASIIKRQELRPTNAKKNADGVYEWSLATELGRQTYKKFDPAKVVEIWAITNERRVHKWPGSALATMKFQAEAQAKTKGGGIVIIADGFEPVRANHLAFHSKPVKELPIITPDDE